MSISIQQPQATDELVSQFGLVGRPTLRLDEVVVPVHVLHDHLWQNCAGFGVALAGGAGFRSLVMLSNTMGPERPVYVERATVQLGAAGFVLVMQPSAAIAGTASTDIASRDFRYQTPTSSIVTRNNAAAPAGTTFLDYQWQAGDGFIDIPLGVMLGGGQAGFVGTRSLVIMPAADNITITVNFYFAESIRREPQEPRVP